MEYLLISLIILVFVVSYFIHRKNMKLLCSVSSPKRGTKAERKLIIKMLKKGVHPKAIFHDLYVRKRNGEFSQIDIVVATPQGLLAIEVKDYSGWLFGNEKQQYWTQILNFGQEKYRFYNPIMQNDGHIKALRELSEQFANLTIFNIVLFDGNCMLKNVNYSANNMFVGYTNNITYVLKKVSECCLAKYTDKKEIVHLLHKAVDNGNNQEIVLKHMASVQRKSIGTPKLTISWHSGNFKINWRRFIRY